MFNREFIITPAEVRVEFRISPTIILMHSLNLIGFYEDTNAGLHSWVAETFRSLTPEQKHRHNTVMMCLPETLASIDDTDFPRFIDQVAQMDPRYLQSELLVQRPHHPADYPGPQAILNSVEVYVELIRGYFASKKMDFNETLIREVHALIVNPPLMQQTIVAHLRWMWDTFLAKEWKRSQGMLHESAAAYSKKDFSGLNAFEAVEAVTGRDMRGTEKLEEALEKARRLFFIPSPHLGPYISWESFNQGYDCAILFGARLPRGTESTSPALNRTELLVWLNALADDTRLKMLDMLFEHEELCAQDFIDMLELSQSSASRHLRQLTASGLLKVRRRDVNKCYTLNQERIEDTMTALGKFLHK
ncbi:MAG: metalloregulator ArsR/SmtB family transcription factor [Anaerolineae bacterium]|nr:metalloregulator ArsR/SmtB family transcription factor [Anaerolineae bacterium]